MKSVYKNALLTISATSATTSTVGLYFDRNVDLLLPVFIKMKWDGLPQGAYQIYDSHLWQDNIEEAPLNKRA